MRKLHAPVTNEERELVMEICEGSPDLVKFIGHMRIICMDARDTGFDGYMDILRWCRRNNLKGLNFQQWFKEKQDGSILKAIAFVRMKVHSDFGIKKIFAKPL
jgi:hypothetical protein